MSRPRRCSASPTIGNLVAAQSGRRQWACEIRGLGPVDSTGKPVAARRKPGIGGPVAAPGTACGEDHVCSWVVRIGMYRVLARLGAATIGRVRCDRHHSCVSVCAGSGSTRTRWASPTGSGGATSDLLPAAHMNQLKGFRDDTGDRIRPRSAAVGYARNGARPRRRRLRHRAGALERRHRQAAHRIRARRRTRRRGRDTRVRP